ncbi:hypothetical protein DH2020_038388 [Rehmannia glutinosa]|uniref:Myb/SANT-like domain-containing protein n=1 Tax=Rehmannia glutinosa TaxID=99300 RepID=A0ABR0UYP7_REHGL
MDVSSGNLTKPVRKRNDKGRRSWSRREEEALVAALKEVIANGWKSENGFKIGYLQALEQEIQKIIPGIDLKGIPHINSKIHVWKKDYGSLVTMLSRSGIGWNGIPIQLSSRKHSSDVCIGKKVAGGKRKSTDGVDPLYEIMKTFCQSTDARLGDIAKRIGYDMFEYDISFARNEVFGVVRNMQGLSLRDKLLVSKLLVKNTEDLELFFSLPDEARAEFARMKLSGSL